MTMLVRTNKHCLKQGDHMFHNFWKLFGGLILALGLLTLGIGGTSIAYFLATPTLPTATYWNAEGGFGDSELVLLQGGRYTNGGIGAVSVDGNYTLKQNQIVFIEFGPADAPCLHIPGTYEWRVQGKVLTLKAVNDPCPTRLYDWSFGEWLKQH
jgi:hypothetical protein